MIDGVTNSGSLPVLERLLQFTGQRHRIITNNIANLSTPGFQPADVSVTEFQEHLGKAIDARRSDFGEASGPLHMQSTREIEFQPTTMELHPQAVGDNMLFHDGNDRDVERTMQDLVENFMTYRAAAQLIKSRFESLAVAIRERM
jgi:flagellar basal-body rod protein FlgB